jgi:hypothetical protein
MKPWFEREADIIKFPEPEAEVIKLPDVAQYPDFITGVQDLKAKLSTGKITQEIHDKLYTDLIHRFMRKESFETPWFLREAPEDQGIMSLPQAKIKNRVLGALEKRREDDPIFDKIYKTIVGKQLDTRIKNYIGAHSDPDIGASEMAFLIKEIPQLGTTQEVKNFVTLWNKGEDFINIDALIPQQGMEESQAIESIITDGIPKALFQSLAKNQSQFTKSDAGPAEGALAIMSKQISYAKTGGDLVINGQKVEVKSGGRGRGGGRIYNDKKVLDQSGMTNVLNKIGYKGNISVLQGTGQGRVGLPANFPTKEFATELSKAFFGKIIPKVVSTFGTSNFRSIWNQAIYNDYQASAGHTGILIIGATRYQYITNGKQLLTVPQSNPGALYYPASTQTRDLGIQVKLP